MNRRLAARDDLGRPELIAAAGDHVSIIDPASTLWRATIARAEEVLVATPQDS
jgi:hypothetical protein